MPRKWHTHWPTDDPYIEKERDGLMHTLGNLTLLTSRLNSRVSNGPWLGTGGKREGLEQHDVLILNREILRTGKDERTTESIRLCTQELTAVLVKIWPVPPGHRSGLSREIPKRRKKLTVLDLLAGGALEPGMSLFPRMRKFDHQVATLLADGRVEVDGTAFANVTDAADRYRWKTQEWLVVFATDQASRRSLRAVRQDYREAMAVDVEDDDSDEDEDEDDVEQLQGDAISS